MQSDLNADERYEKAQAELAALREQLAARDRVIPIIEDQRDTFREMLARAEQERDEWHAEDVKVRHRQERRIAELEAARQPAPLPEHKRIEAIREATFAAVDAFAAELDAAHYGYAARESEFMRLLARRIGDEDDDWRAELCERVHKAIDGVGTLRALLSLPAPSAPATAPNVARALELLREAWSLTCAGWRCREPIMRAVAELEAPVAQAAPAREPVCPVHLMGPCPCRECRPGEDFDCRRCGGDGCDPEVRTDCEPTQQAAPIDEAVEDRAREAMIQPTSANKLSGRWAAPREEPRNPRAELPPCDHDACGPLECTVPTPTFAPGELSMLLGVDDDTPAPAPSLARLHALANRWKDEAANHRACMDDSSDAHSHGYHEAYADACLGCAGDLTRALAAGAELPGLPEGWTATRDETGAPSTVYVKKGKRRSVRVECYDDGDCIVDDTDDDYLRATELHAVLAHHLAHASKGGA